jgi:signal peptidase I
MNLPEFWRKRIEGYPGFLSPWGTHSPGWKMLPRALKSLRTWVVLALILLGVGFFQQEVIGVYVVPSASMKNTLLVGDVFIANKLAYGLRTPRWFGIPGTDFGHPIPSFTLIEGTPPQSGDVIVFRFPKNPSEIYVKRVVASGGDNVLITHRQVIVNGVELPTPPNARLTFARFFKPGMVDPTIFPPGAGNQDNYGPVTVPDGHYFVLGDNRGSSTDSRFWGFLPEELVLGKAEFIIFSHGSDIVDNAMVEHTRFERVGRWVY